MQVINPFFNTQTTISDVDQLAGRLLALSDQDTQLISDVLSLAQEDASLLSKLNQHTTVIDQQAALVTQLQTDVSHAQALAGASRENLLINPRGKINQANEPDGVLAAGTYFCDGWKAGANGAEVYRDADGFRLVSGSIVQLVPNNVEPNQTLRGNLTTVSGAPQIKINSGTDSAQSDSAEYIHFEVCGDNSKFTKLVLAESAELPIYSQKSDELTPCYRFLFVEKKRIHTKAYSSTHNGDAFFPVEMIAAPAITLIGSSVAMTLSGGVNHTTRGFHFNSGGVAGYADSYIADARP